LRARFSNDFWPARELIRRDEEWYYCGHSSENFQHGNERRKPFFQLYRFEIDLTYDVAICSPLNLAA
jgi:hypothetical protein